VIALRAAALSALLAGIASAALAQETPNVQQLLDRLGEIQAEAGAQPAPELLPPAQIEQQIGERLGVQVLSVEPVEPNGDPRYAVKVMNPPGNYNGAFLVSTLLVDAVSGEVVGEAGPEGGLVRPIQVPASDAESGLEARRRTYR
jgi:hypothetical protein